MTKHNAALAYYIQSWQLLVNSLPLGAQGEVWHKDAAPISGDMVAATALGWSDLAEALRQYENWQNVPRYGVEARVIWRSGGARLMDFGGSGFPVVMVSSMINGHEIFDMPSPASLVGFLRDAGFHPFVLHWGYDDEADRGLGVADYQLRLQEAIGAVGDCHLMGYCLGGTLAFATAIAGVKRQVLLGVPWQFQHDQGRIGEFSQFLASESPEVLEAQLRQVEMQYGVMPSMFVDFLFALLNPLQFVQKFRHRGARADTALFDALEDWLDSGRNMPMALVRELLLSWFREDTLARGNWRNNTPTLAIFGSKDHIAPPKSCQAIAKAGENVQLLEHQGGHVGLLVGNQARSIIWPQVAAFLNDETE